MGIHRWEINGQRGALLKSQKQNDNQVTLFITNRILVKIWGIGVVEYHTGQTQDSSEYDYF